VRELEELTLELRRGEVVGIEVPCTELAVVLLGALAGVIPVASGRSRVAAGAEVRTGCWGAVAPPGHGADAVAGPAGSSAPVLWLLQPPACAGEIPVAVLAAWGRAVRERGDAAVLATTPSSRDTPPPMRPGTGTAAAPGETRDGAVRGVVREAAPSVGARGAGAAVRWYALVGGRLVSGRRAPRRW
jgi:hypothetical protein